MSQSGGCNEGIQMLPEIVCKAIPNAAAFPNGLPTPPGDQGRNGGTSVVVDPVRRAELQSLSTQQLLELVASQAGKLTPAELLILQEIAQERAARLSAETDLVTRLLAACQRAGQSHG